MINTTLNIKRAFREKVNKCMKTTFGEITQPHIKTTLAKIKQECQRYYFKCGVSCHPNLVLKSAYLKDLDEVDPFSINGVDGGK